MIHQIWIGDTPPDRDIAYAETIRDMNPDREFILWSDSHIEGPWSSIRPLPTSRMEYLFDDLKRICSKQAFPAALSDILRVEILLDHGGIYLDTDIFCVKPLDPLFGLDLFIPQEFCCRMIGNFALGGRAHHPAFYRFLNYVHENIAKKVFGKGTIDPVKETGPLTVRRALSLHPDCCILPYLTLSPWSQSYRMPDNWKDLKWSESTLAVHAFSSKWIDVKKMDGDGTSPTWYDRKDRNGSNYARQESSRRNGSLG